MPKRHYDCFTNNENESERYREGEELRPPFFLEDLFKNIPKLLSECIVEEEACTTTRNIRRPAQYSKNGQRRFTGCGEALCLHGDACARKPTL